MSELLKVEGLCAGYGEAVVLQNISLTLAEGESLALLGRNGTGKTTLLNTLAGATQQHAGQIAFASHALHTMASHQRAAAGIGWVPQERNIFKSLTVHENLTAVARAHGLAQTASLGRQNVFTRCFRAWQNARPIWVRNYQAANNKCWLLAGPWCSILDCCCWTNRSKV